MLEAPSFVSFHSVNVSIYRSAHLQSPIIGTIVSSLSAGPAEQCFLFVLFAEYFYLVCFDGERPVSYLKRYSNATVPDHRCMAKGKRQLVSAAVSGRTRHAHFVHTSLLTEEERTDTRHPNDDYRGEGRTHTRPSSLARAWG